MPIYEYLCDGCQFHFEIKQKVSETPLSTCERCGSPLRKLISSPAIMFKGSGWYVTDYSDKLKPPAQTDGGTAPENGKKESSTAPAGSTASTSSNTSAGAGDGAASSASKSGADSTTPASSKAPTS